MPDDFDDRVLNLLSSISAQDATDCLNKLESALRIPNSVRNPSAYLAGVIKRVTGATAGGHGGGHSGGGSAVPASAPTHASTAQQLAPDAARVLEQLHAEGRVRPGELEGRNMGTMASLPPEVQLFAMRTFADRNLTGIRNMAGALRRACDRSSLRCVQCSIAATNRQLVTGSSYA
jgi:hypothetical protein